MKLNTSYIIAEAGVNHNGSIPLAVQLIEKAASAGADAVKFQTFKSELLVTPFAKKAEYQLKQTGGQAEQLEMLKALELSEKDYPKLLDAANANKLEFLSTPFDLESLAFLVSLGLKKIKIASGEVTNGPLLLAAGQTGLPVILSCGMATLEEIQAALSVLSFGYLHPKRNPSSLNECLALWEIESTQKILQEKVILLHCTSAYPAAFSEINLKALHTIAETFKLRVGYSDHSLGILVPTLAIACGATLIEKHFTLDKTMTGPDHSASLEPQELAEMVSQIRLVEKIMGSGEKQPTITENKNKQNVRRGLYALKSIKRGDNFCLDNLIALRPENATSSMKLWDLQQKTAENHYEKYGAICEE